MRLRTSISRLEKFIKKDRARYSSIPSSSVKNSGAPRRKALFPFKTIHNILYRKAIELCSFAVGKFVIFDNATIVPSSIGKIWRNLTGIDFSGKPIDCVKEVATRERLNISYVNQNYMEFETEEVIQEGFYRRWADCENMATSNRLCRAYYIIICASAVSGFARTPDPRLRHPGTIRPDGRRCALFVWRLFRESPRHTPQSDQAFI